MAIDTVSLLWGVGAGASVTGLLAWVLVMQHQQRLNQYQEGLKNEAQQAQWQAQGYQSERDQALAQLVELKQSLEQLQTQLRKVSEEKAGLEASQQIQLQQWSEWKEQLNKEWTEKFELLSRRTLETVQQQFQETSTKEFAQKETRLQENLTELLKPLTTMIKDHEKAVAELGEQTVRETTTLKVELQKSIEQTEKLVQAKNHIITALTQSKGRGDWGELELIRLLEESGLQRGIHYEFQPVQDDLSRPDIQIKLPNNHIIYIDAKTLLVELEKIEQADTIEDQLARDEARRKQTQNLRAEILKLSKRAYQTKDAGSVDFVVLYVPRESMLRIPLEEDPTLMQDAFRQHVVLASPLILMGLLKTVAQGWNQAQISQRAIEVQELGRDLHRKAALFVERFEKLGKMIDTMTRQYDETRRAFSGRQGFIPQMKKFELLGCASDKKLEALSLDEDDVEVIMDSPLESSDDARDERILTSSDSV